MGGGPESRCVGRVYGLDGARHGWGGFIDGNGVRSQPFLPIALLPSSPKLISQPVQSARHNADYVWSLLPTYV